MFTKNYNNKTIKEIQGFKLGEPKIEKVNIIELTCKFMHGDADYYTTEKLEFSLDGESKDGDINFKESINFLLRCMAAFPCGMGGNDGYWDVDGWCDEWAEIFPADNESCDGHASPDTITAFYYNENGIKCELNLDVKDLKS